MGHDETIINRGINRCVLPSIHAKNYHCILQVTKSNNILGTLNQAELSH